MELEKEDNGIYISLYVPIFLYLAIYEESFFYLQLVKYEMSITKAINPGQHHLILKSWSFLAY